MRNARYEVPGLERLAVFAHEHAEAPVGQRARPELERLEALAFPGLGAAVTFCEVGTPKTNRKFLNREDGTYGPIPARRPTGLLGMPFNRTDVPGLYAVGDR